MAVIFSYPIKSTPDNNDLILISDGTDNLTKQVRVSTLPGGSAAGVSSFNTLTGAVTITGGTNVTLNPVGNNIEINASGGGDTYTLQAEVKSSNSIPLKLDAATGSDSTVSLTEGANVTLTRNSATEITIASTGGGTPDTPLNSVQFNNAGAFGGSSSLLFSNNKLSVTYAIDVKGDGANAGKINLYCQNTTTPHAVTIEAVSYTHLTLPTNREV